MEGSAEKIGAKIPKDKIEQEKTKMFKILIDEQDNTDKNQPVFVGLNGKSFLIKRGHEVIVPEGVVNVLKESIYTIVEKDEEGNDIERNIPRFALRILGEVN